MLAKFTMRPQPLSRIPPTKARHRLNVPVTLTAKVAAHSSAVVSHSGLFGPTIPALLTRMSTGPMRSAAAATAAGSLTSVMMSAPGAMSSVMTSIASRVRRSAQARPSPLAPPVITAVRVISASLPARTRVWHVNHEAGGIAA